MRLKDAVARARTFHCRVRELLVRLPSFGDNGTSGTLQCVLKEPASEHEPRTELYIADTLQQMGRISNVQNKVGQSQSL